MNRRRFIGGLLSASALTAVPSLTLAAPETRREAAYAYFVDLNLADFAQPPNHTVTFVYDPDGRAWTADALDRAQFGYRVTDDGVIGIMAA